MRARCLGPELLLWLPLPVLRLLVVLTVLIGVDAKPHQRVLAQLTILALNELLQGLPGMWSPFAVWLAGVEAVIVQCSLNLPDLAWAQAPRRNSLIGCFR
jgi:hypothetical protein